MTAHNEDMMASVSPQELNSSESRSKRRRLSSMASDSPRELGHMRRRHETGSTTFVGSGSGIHFVRMVRQALAKNTPRSSMNPEANDEELVPGEDDRQHATGLLWHADEVVFPRQDPEHDLSNPTFDDLVRWTKPYFASWHPPFPYLHAPTFLGLLEKVSIHSLGCLEHTDLVIIRSVMSISVADRRQAPREEACPVPAHLLYENIEEALSALQRLLIQPSSIPALQAAASIQLFLISMLRLSTASRIGGMIVRMSYHLGLHRCSSRFPQLSPMEQDIRRRLFWSIYCIERYLSQALGQPLELKDDDLDVCFPGLELHTSRDTPDPSPRIIQDSRRMMLPTALARHGRIKGLILELRNKSILHSRTDLDEIAHIDAEISKWWNDTQELLDPLSTNEPILWNSQTQEAETYPERDPIVYPLKESHKLLLIIEKHELVILLNRPVITSGYDTPAHAAALEKCIGASKAIIRNVYRHINKGMREVGIQGGRIHDPLVWPGFVWLIWQSGLILLYAALEGRYSVQTAESELDCSVAILQNLALRGDLWPSACGAALKKLQTSLREKMVGEPETRRNMTERRYSPSAASQQLGAELRGVVAEGKISSGSLNKQHRSPVLEVHRQQVASKGHEGGTHLGDNFNNGGQLYYAARRGQQQGQQSFGTCNHSQSASRAEAPSTVHSETSLVDSFSAAGRNTAGWPAANGYYDGGAATFSGFDEVFQLMDMPHTLNDLSSQPQLGLLDSLDHYSYQPAVTVAPRSIPP